METKETSKQIQEVEVWKEVTIEGYEHYLVSNKSRIWNSRTNNFIKGCNDRGYKRIHLCDNGRVYVTGLHRLVALAFIPNPDNKPQVNHIDGNPSNNCIDNLEWVTNQENVQHAWDTGLNTKQTGVKSERVLKNLEKIEQMLLEGRTYYFIADFFGVHSRTIKQAIEEFGLKESDVKKADRNLYSKFTKKEVETIYLELKSGSSYTSLKKKYNTNADTLKRYLFNYYGKEHINNTIKNRKTKYTY